MKRVLTLLLCLMMLLFGCAGRAPEAAHADLPFSAMPDSGTDAALECARARELVFRIGRGELCGERARAALTARNEALKRIETDEQIAYVRYCLDVTDVANKARYDALSVGTETLRLLLSDAEALLSGGSERYSDPAVASLLMRERELVGRYEALSVTLFIEYGGRTWTGDAILSDPTLSEADFSALYEAYMRLFHAEAAAIFLDLIDVRNAIAAACGFDSYVDYAYARSGRDYTPADAQRFSERAKDAFAPLFSACLTAFYPAAAQLYGTVFPIDPTLPRIGEEICSLLPELETPWNYMIRHGLYDLGANETRMPASFAAYFPAYGAPFLFGSWTDGFEMIPTVAHAFGQYASLFRNGTVNPCENASDLVEFEAQGLELLTVLRYDKLYGDRKDAAETAELFYAVYTLLSGCMEHAFCRFAYEETGMDAARLDAEYARLLEAYGLCALGLDPRSWTQTAQTFRTPFESIGCAAAMNAALELYLLSRTDADGAVQICRRAMNRGGTRFRETLRDAGLSDPFDPETPERIACGLENARRNRKNE